MKCIKTSELQEIASTFTPKEAFLSIVDKIANDKVIYNSELKSIIGIQEDEMMSLILLYFDGDNVAFRESMQDASDHKYFGNKKTFDTFSATKEEILSLFFYHLIAHRYDELESDTSLNHTKKAINIGIGSLNTILTDIAIEENAFIEEKRKMEMLSDLTLVYTLSQKYEDKSKVKKKK